MRRLAVALVVLAAAGCSAGDPPDPDAARTTTEAEEVDDATLDAVEERFEDGGVKDVRADGTGVVTIRLEDGRVDAGPVCAAVREAGFAEIRVEVDGVVGACP